MIIISQDKKEIINFNNIKNIKLDPVMDYKHIIVNVGDSSYITIAGYETEIRAKEVLQEIEKTYIENKIIEMYSHLGDVREPNRRNYALTPAYEMPIN